MQNYTDRMWRRFAQALVVWISLIGLIPAALACAQVMAEHDCCPAGQQMPCGEEPATASVESAACCATSSLAPAAIKATSEQAHVDADLLLTLHAPWTTLHLLAVADPSASGCLQIDSPDVPIDLSLTYLQTGRLRL